MSIIKHFEEFIPNSDTLKNKFESLKSIWWEETKRLSNPDKKYNNKYYQEIISLGPEVIPTLLEDLNNLGGDWCPALRMITGQSPIKEEHIGKVDKMNQDWLEWAKNQNILINA